MPRRSDRLSGPTSCLGCRNCSMCLTQVLRQCSTPRGGDQSIAHRWWKLFWHEAQRSTKSKGRMHSLQMLHCACRALATNLKCEQNFQVRACPRFGCSFPAHHRFGGRRAAGSAPANGRARKRPTATAVSGPRCRASPSPRILRWPWIAEQEQLPPPRHLTWPQRRELRKIARHAPLSL